MEHDHHHPAPQGLSRALVIGIGLNLLFILIEAYYGLAAHSMALLADAGHNASDVLGLVLALVAVLLTGRRASGRFTYGLQSASILAAVLNALLLFIALAGIGYEAIERLQNPQETATDTVITVALIGVLINAATAWMLHRGSHDLNIHAAFLHMAADAGISLGVAAAAFVMGITGWQWLDSVTSLLIALVIARSTWKLLRESMAMAMHAAPAALDIKAVRAALAQLPGVAEVHDLHIWAISTTTTALSAHLVMPSGHPGDDFLHRALHLLEDRFNIGHATLQIEVGRRVHPHHSGCDHDHHDHDHHHD